MMERIQFEGQAAFVAEAAGLAEEGFDFVVDAFHASIADAVFPPSEDAAGMSQQGLAQLPHLAHARGDRQVVPFMQIGFHLGVAGLFPEQAQRFLQQIRRVQRFVVFAGGLRRRNSVITACHAQAELRP